MKTPAHCAALDSMRFATLSAQRTLHMGISNARHCKHGLFITRFRRITLLYGAPSVYDYVSLGLGTRLWMSQFPSLTHWSVEPNPFQEFLMCWNVCEQHMLRQHAGIACAHLEALVYVISRTDNCSRQLKCVEHLSYRKRVKCMVLSGALNWATQHSTYTCECSYRTNTWHQ